MPNPPVLYVFAISHFCEKARWALDYCNLDYHLVYPLPGIHIKVAKQLNVAGTSVPILSTADGAIQGSAAIVDWAFKYSKQHRAEHNTSPDRTNSLDTQATDADIQATVQRLEATVGAHTRRFYYSEALVHDSASVRRVFALHQSTANRMLLRLSWPLLRRMMIKGLDLGATQYRDSLNRLNDEVQWLDDLLSDGRQWLHNDRFSEADLTAASLLSPLVLPDEHPVYATLQVPQRIQRDLADWQERPGFRFVRRVYRDKRH